MPFDFNMDSISPVEGGGGITPTGTISITANGSYDVTNYASADVSVAGGEKYGANANTFLGDVDANGILQQPTEESDLVFTGVEDVAEFGLYCKFINTKVKSVSFPDLTTVSGQYACANMLYSCTALTSISLPNLTTISGSYGCSQMLGGCTALTSISLPALTTISGSYGCRQMLQGCTALTSVSLPALTTISGSYGCSQMLQGCAALTSVSLPALTTISGSYGCQFMFQGCTALTDVYFPALTTTSFGSLSNQFTGIMNNTGSGVIHTLHFPSNLESTIQGLSGYPRFGGSVDYVVIAFDLPATE